MAEEHKKKWYISVLNVIGWILGLLLLLGVILSIFQDFDLGGFIFGIIISALLIPPTRRLIFNLFSKAHIPKIHNNKKTKVSVKDSTPYWKKHPVISVFGTVFLILIVVGVISEIVRITSNGEKVYVNENLEDIHFMFTSKYSDYTDLQKKELWKNYDGKWVNGTIFVNSVDKNMMGTYVILGTFQPKGAYDIGNDISLFLDDSQYSKAIQIHNGEIITFEGKLSGYHDIMGNIDLEKGIILS